MIWVERGLNERVENEGRPCRISRRSTSGEERVTYSRKRPNKYASIDTWNIGYPQEAGDMVLEGDELVLGMS